MEDGKYIALQSNLHKILNSVIILITILCIEFNHHGALAYAVADQVKYIGGS